MGDRDLEQDIAPLAEEVLASFDVVQL